MSNTTDRESILLFCNMPPSPSLAAEIAEYIANVFRNNDYRLTCVISESAPWPASENLKDITIRPRTLLKCADQYKNAKALYVISDHLDCLHALDFMVSFPGVALLLNSSFPELAQALLAETNIWENTLCERLSNDYKDDGEVLVDALQIHRRFATEILADLNIHIDVLDACKLVTFEPKQTAVFAQKNNLNISQLDFPAPLFNAAKDRPCRRVIIRGDDSVTSSISAIESNLMRCGLDIELIHASLGTPELIELIESSSLVVDLTPPKAQTISFMTEIAHSIGIPTITTSEGWGTRYSNLETTKAPFGANDVFLSAAIGHLLTHSHQEIEKAASPSSSSHFLHQINQFVSTGPTFGDCLNSIEENAFKHVPWHNLPAIESDKSVLDWPAYKTGDQAMLVGAVPGNILLKQLFPDLDVNLSPRVATPGSCAILSSLTKLSYPRTLARFNYEAFTLAHKDDTDGCKSPAWLQKRVKDIPAIVFANDQFESSAFSLNNIELPLSFTPVKHWQTGEFEDTHYQSDSGMFWFHSKARNCVYIFLPTGVTQNAKLVLSNPEYCISIITESESYMIDTNSSALMVPDQLGLFRFSLSLYHKESNTPVNAKETISCLAKAGLKLQW